MKRLILALFLLGIFVVSSFSMISYINKVSSELNSLLIECSVATYNKDIEKLNSSLKKLEKTWNEKQDMLSIFIHGKNIIELNDCIKELSVIVNKKELNEIDKAISACSNKIEQIIENERISFTNILKLPVI